MQPLQPAAQHIDIMLPHRFAEEILAVWQLPPLRLSPAECRSCSAMMLAAQTLRHSSRDCLRVLAQEATFDLKHSESKAALLTVPYPVHTFICLLRCLVTSTSSLPAMTLTSWSICVKLHAPFCPKVNCRCGGQHLYLSLPSDQRRSDRESSTWKCATQPD